MAVTQQHAFEELSKLVRLENVAAPVGASDELLTSLERKLGVLIPAAVANWFSVCDGAGVGLGRLIGVHESVLEFYALMPHWQTEQWIPLASDGCGSYFLVSCRPRESGEPSHPVFFSDCSDCCENETYVVASDIWHFVWFYCHEALRQSIDVSAMRVGVSSHRLFNRRHTWPMSRRFVLSVDPSLAQSTLTLPWQA